MRGRIDTRAGMWPAFWTLGETGEWPRCGEIDIMEYYRGKLLANVAWGTPKRWNAKWNSKSKPIANFADPDWASKFHVWTMDWDKDKIVLSVDGEVLNTQTLSKTINGDAEGKKSVSRAAISSTQSGDWRTKRRRPDANGVSLAL